MLNLLLIAMLTLTMTQGPVISTIIDFQHRKMENSAYESGRFHHIAMAEKP